MKLDEANAALDAAITAAQDAAHTVLSVIAAEIAESRPGATLRLTPEEYDTGVDIDIVVGGAATRLTPATVDYQHLCSPAYAAAEVLFGGTPVPTRTEPLTIEPRQG